MIFSLSFAIAKSGWWNEQHLPIVFIFIFIFFSVMEFECSEYRCGGDVGDVDICWVVEEMLEKWILLRRRSGGSDIVEWWRWSLDEVNSVVVEEMLAKWIALIGGDGDDAQVDNAEAWRWSCWRKEQRWVMEMELLEKWTTLSKNRIVSEMNKSECWKNV